MPIYHSRCKTCGITIKNVKPRGPGKLKLHCQSCKPSHDRLLKKQKRERYNRKHRDSELQKRRQRYHSRRHDLSTFIRRMYVGMIYRVRHDADYIGLPIAPRELFLDFAKSSRTLAVLYKEWQDSSFNIKKIPTPDRIDSSKGYTLDNIQFLTMSDNASKQ